MGWNPYTDYRNRGYISILTSLFPEQTKTLPRLLVWSLIFLLDLILGVVGAYRFGLLELESKLALWVLIAGIIGVFWLQGRIWYTIVNWFRKRNALD